MSKLNNPLFSRTKDEILQDFPGLNEKVNGHELTYLDSAATSLKCRAVIDSLRNYYEKEVSNIHRGIHSLSENATAAFENTREEMARFIGAEKTKEIIFTKGTTEAINLLAYALEPQFKAGDEIILTALEHHSNIVPWQILAKRTGAMIREAPIFDNGELDLDSFRALLNERTKLVAVSHVSNVLGTILPVRKITKLGKDAGALVLIDGAQAVSHLPLKMNEIAPDFYVFSVHKMYGPEGVGILYGKEAELEKLSPYQGGGSMIHEVKMSESSYNELPFRLEAGTPNIGGVIASKSAIRYIDDIEREKIAAYEHELLSYGEAALESLKGLKIFGKAPKKTSVLSFSIEGIHPQDLATLLDQQGIAIRTGHHCCMPLLARLGVNSLARASLAVYSTKRDIDKLVEGIEKARKLL